MKKFSIQFILLIFILQSCDGTYVTKNVIESQNFSFQHAGKTEDLLFELKEIKTFTRKNGIFSRNIGPVQKNTTFDFAIYASVSDGNSLNEIFEFPCSKDVKLDDFVSMLKIKRSKKRDHFAIAYKNETIAIFNTFKGISFLAKYPLEESGFEYLDFSKLDLNQLDNAREDLLKHISGRHKLVISDKKLHDILIKTSPKDELNYELSFSIANEEIFSNKTYQSSIIKHCSKDLAWKRNALSSLKNKKDKMSFDQYFSKLFAIGGMEEVGKEDNYQLNIFYSSGNISYFKERYSMGEIIVPESIESKLKENLITKLKNPCSLSKNQFTYLIDYFFVLEKMKFKNGFEVFFENYENSTCHKKSIHDISNEFLFPSSSIGESDKRKWISFLVKNFNNIPATNRSWDYSMIENDLSCEQKKLLLTKYKKDIDTFDDKEIPVCN